MNDEQNKQLPELELARLQQQMRSQKRRKREQKKVHALCIAACLFGLIAILSIAFTDINSRIFSAITYLAMTILYLSGGILMLHKRVQALEKKLNEEALCG